MVEMMISTSSGIMHDRMWHERMGETLEARFIFALSFVVFLLAALLGRLVPGLTPRRAGGGRRSIFGDARSAASECVSFAFMS